MWRSSIQSGRKAKSFIALFLGMVTLMFAGLVLSAQGVEGRAIDFADPAFQAQWQRADKPVQDGSAGGRSWVWGPAFSEGKQEAYAESPGGQRLVQYFDKARMEINNPNGNRNDKYFVTNGLLVRDMIAGVIQNGDKNLSASEVGPATIPVAGDPDNNSVALTYASFAPVASIGGGNRVAKQIGQPVSGTLSQDGVAGQNPGTAGYGVTAAYYEDTLGHNIPNVFWNFLNQQGPVFANNGLSNGLIVEWQVAAGLPLTEAYWSRAVVAGVEKDVLVQMFERRVLTYTPSNNDPFKVEMGNVGQHYYKWRYTNPPAQTPAPTAVPPTPTPTVVPAGPANWISPRRTQDVAKPVIKVRPTDGDIWVIGENKGAQGIFASDSNSNFGNVLNLAPGSSGERVSADFDANGYLHVVWHDRPSNVFHTYYARINPSGKQEWKRDLGNELVGGGVSGVPYIHYSPYTKRLYLVQEEGNNTAVLYESGDGGQTWGSRQVIGGGNGTAPNAKVVVDANGNVHVIYSSRGSDLADLYARDRIGGNWSGAYNVTQYNGSLNVGTGSLAAGPNGEVYLTWVSATGDGGRGVGFTSYDSGANRWRGRRDNISNTQNGWGTFKSINIATTSNGNVWIGVSMDTYDHPERAGAYYMVSTNGGANWSDIRPIFNMDNTDVGNIASSGNNVYYVGLFHRQTYYSYRGQ